MYNNATAEHYSTLLWKTSGNGSFDYTSAVNPTYTPGANDKLAGSVKLSLLLEGLNSCGFADEDQMTLTIYRPPTLEIISPGEGDIFYDYPITATGTAADPDGDLTEVYSKPGW